MRPAKITKPFVLRDDVVLVPCAELDDDLRGRFTYDAGDYTLSRRSGRARSQLIDGQTAALLALFREPRTIVDAVVENSRAYGKEPRARLAELLPHLGAFVDDAVLVPADAAPQREVRARFEPGHAVAGWEIVRCASLVDDGEVYEVRNAGARAALKIARAGTPKLRALFRNEATVLRHLDGAGIAPRLLAGGVHEKRPYLIVDWVDGVDAVVAAKERRHDRAALLALCVSLARAYAALHADGVVHGDVHARNVVVGRAGIVLLDFAYARLAGRRSGAARAGVPLFAAPEALRGASASAPAEQYSLAAMLYLLIADHHYLHFRLAGDEMQRQVESEPPLSFAQRGVAPWPDVERVLFRALEKNPRRRFASMADFAAALAACSTGESIVETTLRSFARGGAMFAAGYSSTPAASIAFGCAGAAVGLLRIAETRGDPALLALASVWQSRAAASAAYADTVTPYLGESGGHAAAAMIAAASGDAVARQRAVDAFVRVAGKPCASLDLTHGRCGALLGAALLLESDGDAAALRAFGTRTLGAIWRELDARPRLARTPRGRQLGMAHGWAGYLFAALRWCATSGDALPPRLIDRLDEYSAWRGTIGSWCNGSAGQLFLFTLAHRVLGDERWLRRAEEAAETTWSAPRELASLCCGTAGRAYALLDFHRHTGNAEWLHRARELAAHAAANAAATAQVASTLYQGELGVAVLLADLERPEQARMPFFG